MHGHNTQMLLTHPYTVTIQRCSRQCSELCTMHKSELGKAKINELQWRLKYPLILLVQKTCTANCALNI